MKESQSKPTLNQLIDEAHEGASFQQAAGISASQLPKAQPAFKTIVSVLLLAALALALFIQYPRFRAPYIWPDAKSSAVMAEADMEAVASLIEVYRVSQGQYPAVLSQVALPEGLSALVASSLLVYTPADGAYTLDWTLPNWHATYDSKSGKTTVESAGKH
jgi:hypothetical protein